MNGMGQLFWMVIGAILSFFVGLFLDIFLPEKYRIKFQLKKKKLSKWIKNPSYLIGITSRLDFKDSAELNDVKKKLRQIFSGMKPTFKGTELHFRNSKPQYDIEIIIQLAYEEDQTEEIIKVYSLNVTVDSKAKYRDMRSQIDDLRAALEETEKGLIRNFNLFPARRVLYTEIEYLEEFSEILENLSAKQISGIVKDTNVKFTYYENRLVIEDTINSRTIQWFKDIIAYVG